MDGLEYLYGIWDGETFTALWAHDHTAERDALVHLFETFDARLSEHPRAHVYHYAAYEITALRRLCTRHGFGEAMLDRWLRERRFCDLFAVVRGGIAASEKSYSIKDMEVLYGFERTGEVKTAGGSIVAYENWLETADDDILAEIEDYNRLDCVSTKELQDWLVANRPELPWPTLAPPQEETHDERDAEAEALRSRLVDADLPAGRGALLFDLARFHARDPNQLPQVIQGAHPHPANLSCLDWMLGGATTIAPGRGLFLPVTRRMHPDLCGYISQQFYEGRLAAHESTARQAIAADGLPTAGAFIVLVEHEGRAQESPEEVQAIRGTVERLLAGTWTDRDGQTRPLRKPTSSSWPPTMCRSAPWRTHYPASGWGPWTSSRVKRRQ